MAAQKSDKSKTPAKPGGMMGLVSKLLGVSAIVLGALFFAAMFDVGQMGLIHTFASSAMVLVPMFAVFALAALFLAPKSGADLDAQAAQITALEEFRSKVTSQVIALQNKLDAASGPDIEALKAHNKELQAQLDAIHQAEREKMDSEVETLRKRNEQLEAQIKQWALETISKNVGGSTQPQQQPQPKKAA